MKTVLSIAGSDCSGGAGIQADIKTITAHQLYAMTAITALTAQNTTGVFAVRETPPEFVTAQLEAVFTDIVPDAVKIGMVANSEIIAAIAEKLKKYEAKNIVLDPVMVATSGGRLMQTSAVAALQELLFPLAAMITPNLPEAQALTGCEITTKAEMEHAALALSQKYGTQVLIKGGHLSEAKTAGMDDVLAAKSGAVWLCGERIPTKNTHGTGCTLSSAIACGLAVCKSPEQAVRDAKAYLTGALKAGLNLGHGNGPVQHCWNL